MAVHRLFFFPVSPPFASGDAYLPALGGNSALVIPCCGGGLPFFHFPFPRSSPEVALSLALFMVEMYSAASAA